jgi:hypothetical protein
MLGYLRSIVMIWPNNSHMLLAAEFRASGTVSPLPIDSRPEYRHRALRLRAMGCDTGKYIGGGKPCSPENKIEQDKVCTMLTRTASINT